MNRFGAAVIRPLVRLWILLARSTWDDIPRPSGPPTAHASGNHPVRVLLVGCGPAIGYGVLSHDLALPGQMARQLGSLWNRGVDVDLIASESMTAQSCADALTRATLTRYNSVVILVGLPDAFRMTGPSLFRERVDRLFALVQQRVTPGIPVVVLGLPEVTPERMLPPLMARIVGAHARLLDAQLEQATAVHSDMVYLPYPLIQEESRHRPAGPEVYAELVRRAIDRLATMIDLSPVAASPGTHDEDARQEALERMNVLGTVPGERLTQITALARRLFGTAIAAVTFLDGDRQWFMVAAGAGIVEAPRDISFCDHTVRHDGPFIVPDATADPRFWNHPMVAGGFGLMFYAGYPLVSPDGHRVGTFCLFDVEVREFTDADTVLLRDLAMLVQDEIWLAQRTLLPSAASTRATLG